MYAVCIRESKHQAKDDFWIDVQLIYAYDDENGKFLYLYLVNEISSSQTADNIKKLENQIACVL